MDSEFIERKLNLQDSPTILFSDIDGTLFSPNINIITAPLYNQQTAGTLQQRNIPFIIVTGRSFWRRIDQYHMTLLGLPKPDAVITANGTIIYWLTRNGYISDFSWHAVMQSTKVTNSRGETFSWNKWDITDEIEKYFKQNHFPYLLGRGNTYLIRIRIDKYSIKQTEQIQKDIKQLFPKGLRVILTEKLLWENTEQIFSGEILITPSTAGKDKAVAYLLKTLSSEMHKPIHGMLFGDASVDIPMLLMKQDEKYFTLSQYAIHPTPLAKKAVLENVDKNLNLRILPDDGPKEILWTLKPQLRKEKKLSAAQNNSARKVVQLFEGMLDRLVDKNLSPNEVSFLGLHKLSKGLSLLHKPKASLIEKTKGLYHYSFGNLTDVLDGIRARRSNKKEENGQLVDGFADRAKEFMQLFHRAKRATIIDETRIVPICLSAISCALPSIARAQVEIGGKFVSERDEKGGSMMDRTRRLFLSLLFTTLGIGEQSFVIDLKIFQTNVATFQHRLSLAKKVDTAKITFDKLSDFQKKALERWLLYIDVLQQEDKIIKKFLSKYPKFLKEYEGESIRLAKNYLELPVSKLRKKWEIKDYKLLVKDYL